MAIEHFNFLVHTAHRRTAMNRTFAGKAIRLNFIVYSKFEQKKKRDRFFFT